jgi:hypothetical protein
VDQKNKPAFLSTIGGKIKVDHISIIYYSFSGSVSSPFTTEKAISADRIPSYSTIWQSGTEVSSS